MRILWLKTEFLHPVDKGGRIRTFQMLREVAREHHVTYLTLDDGHAAADAEQLASEYSAEVVRVPFAPSEKGSLQFYGALARNLMSPLPYAIARYRSALMTARIEAHANNADLVVCDFLAPAVNMPSRLLRPAVLFQHNVEAMIWERHAQVGESSLMKAYMRRQWRRMQRFEGRICQRFDHVIAVSPNDAAVMRAQYGISSVSDVPTGVDVDYFTHSGATARRAYELVFTGSMDWMPNDDAMRWFVQDILPRIRAVIPEVTVTVVGRSPSHALQQLSEHDSQIEVTGRVPDVRPFLERAAAFIVPMRVGGGTRLKIFEAMAMGLPVVSTTVGAEGLPVIDGESACLRDEPQSFADSIIHLLRREDERQRIAMLGSALVRSRFGWAGVASSFMATCSEVVRTYSARHAHAA